MKDVPLDLLIAFVLAAVCLLAAAIGFIYRVKVGDDVQSWLESSDEPQSIRELVNQHTSRPWSLQAAKGFEKRYVIRFGTRGVFVGVRRVPRNVVPFRKVQW